MKRCIAILLALLLLSACGAGARPSDPEPESGSSSISEPAPEPSPSEPEPDPEPVPEEPSVPEEDETFFEEVPPDPGTGIPGSGPSAQVRQQCEAMAEYLEKNLDPWDYTEIWSFSGDGSSIEILAPSPDKVEGLVKGILENYTGVIVPVEYYKESFSKGQLEQAKTDLEKFLESHPEIELWNWKPILLFGGYQIDLKKENDKLTEFIESYPVAGIYYTTVSPDEEPMHWD